MTKHKNNPLLIFDKNIIAKNIREFRDALSSDCHLLFSVKSLPNQELIDWLIPHIEGFDISNEHEASLISKWNQKIVSVVGPCLEVNSIEKVIGKQIDYVYVDESTIVQCHSESDISIRVKVTDFIADLSTNMPSRFGVNRAAIRKIANNYNLTGFHFHASSHAMINIEMFRNFFQFLEEFNFDVAKIKNINIGGGWYSSSNNRLSSTINFLRSLTQAQIYIEPGYGFFYNSGYAVCTILNIDKIGDITYVTTNISPDIHLKWSTPYLIDANYSSQHFFYLCGPTCFEGDILKIDGDAAKLKISDTLTLGGICSYSVGWNTSFNGIQPIVTFFN